MEYEVWWNIINAYRHTNSFSVFGPEWRKQMGFKYWQGSGNNANGLDASGRRNIGQTGIIPDIEFRQLVNSDNNTKRLIK